MSDLASHSGNMNVLPSCAVQNDQVCGVPGPKTYNAQPAADQVLEARITSLELSIIQHPTHTAALKALEGCLERARMRRQGRRLKARALLLYGHAGAGKTTVIEDFANRHPDLQTVDGDIRRVIVVEMPEATTKRALVSAILSEMGYTSSSRDNANDIIADLVDKVKRLGVEMIIIDEGHHVISGKAIQAVTEFLKSLLNRIGCQIVIVGLPELKQLHAFPQLDRRLMPDMVLEPYDWTTVAGRMEFLVLMTKFEALLGLPQPSGLGNETFAMRMYVATGGSIGIVSKYLSRAVELATQRELTNIDLGLLAEIYAAWHPSPQTPKYIDFGAKLKIPVGTTIDDVLLDLRRLPIDEDSNPFACAPERCATLWSHRSAAEHEDVSPRRRTRGTGRKELQAFAS